MLPTLVDGTFDGSVSGRMGLVGPGSQWGVVFLRLSDGNVAVSNVSGLTVSRNRGEQSGKQGEGGDEHGCIVVRVLCCEVERGSREGEGVVLS